MRVVGGDDHVADRGQPGAAAERRALDPSDQRHRQRVERAEQRRRRVRVAQVVLAAVVAHALHPGEVGAGAEDGAGARDHGDAGLAGVGGAGDVVRPGAQRGDQPLVEGVADGGAVQRRPPHRPPALDEQDVRIGARGVSWAGTSGSSRHIRNTPKRVGASGAFSAAAMARPSVSRVDAGSRMPSSQSRAVE